MSLRLGTELPDLSGATEWLNGEVDRSHLIGSPVLVHFWAMSCYICKQNLPTIEAWQQTYGTLGLKVLAVHMPRQESDMDTATVKATATEFAIREPCAIDNTHAIGDAFQTGGFWPHYFLFDAEGKLINRAAGDAGLKMMDGALQRLMQPQPEAVVV